MTALSVGVCFISYLLQCKEPCGVAQFPVAELVSDNGRYLCRAHLLNQRVKDDNVLLPGKSKEECIRVRAARAPVRDMDLAERKRKPVRQAGDPLLDVLALQGRQLEEQRQDKHGVKGDEEYAKAQSRQAEVQREHAAAVRGDAVYVEKPDDRHD